jgi:hypothetical protein
MADVGRSDDVEEHFSDPGPVARERRLAAMARRQYGAVGRDQLIAIGFTAAAIRYRCRCGRLQPVHPRVYAVGAQRLSQRGRWFAALLATRPDPVLSHLSSAAAQQLAAERGGVHVTVERRSGRALAGVVVHRVRGIDPADVVRIDDLPVTSLPRTLLDLAETESYDRVKKIAEAAERMDGLDLLAVRACMERNPGRRGLEPLGRLLDEYSPLAGANEGLERGFQEFVDDYGIPPPLCNVLVGGLLVDFHWPEANLVVELDSREFHAHWSAAERDRERDAHLMRLDIHTLRVTDRRLRLDRDGLARDIEARFLNAGAGLHRFASSRGRGPFR